MRPGTAVCDRRPIPGFERRGSDSRPMSAASKTRPLRRSMSGSVLLVKSELSILLPARLTMKALNPKVQEQIKLLVHPIHRVNVFPLFDALKKSHQDSCNVSSLLRTASNLNKKTMRINARLFAPCSESMEVSKLHEKAKIYRKSYTDSKEKQLNFVSALRRSFKRKIREAETIIGSVLVEHKKTKSTEEGERRERMERKKRKEGRSIEVRIEAPNELRMSTESGENGTRDSVRTLTPKFTFVSQYCDHPSLHPHCEPKKPKGMIVHFSPK